MIVSLTAILVVEALVFALAALLHLGLGPTGYDHLNAAVGEAAICVVLLASLAATLTMPRRRRAIALGAQAFAFIGTLTGLILSGAGVGPVNYLDFTILGAMLFVLAAGSIWTSRRVSGETAAAPTDHAPRA